MGRDSGICGSGRAAGREARGPTPRRWPARRRGPLSPQPAVIAGIRRRCVPYRGEGSERRSRGAVVRCRARSAGVFTRRLCFFSFRVKVRVAATDPAVARRTTRCAERCAGPGRPSCAASGLGVPGGARGRRPCDAWHCVARGAQRAAVSCTASRSCRDEDVSKVSGLVLLSCGVVRVPAPCVLYSMKNGRDLH